MASVTFAPKKAPTPPPEDVHLHLTTEEAEILMRVIGRVGGSSKGPRGKIDGIDIALNNAGIISADIKTHGSVCIDPEGD